ncbi:MAG: OmpA family protein [Saprospiraceae bacterium]
MKKLFLLLMLGSIFSLNAQNTSPSEETVTAQAAEGEELDSPTPAAEPSDQDYPHSISAKVLMINYGVEAPNGSSITNGLEVAYARKFSKYTSIVIPAKVGVLNVLEQPETKRPFVKADVLVRAGYPLLNDRVEPYALIGGGLSVEPEVGTNMQVPMGAGVMVRVTEAAYFTAQYEFRKSFKADRNNSQIGVGLVFNLGRGKFNPKYWDTDGDGVMDHEDQCINIKGSRFMQGCPDSDEDGINDAADPCPLHFGTVKEGGCPDADKDGVADPDDACPNEAGLADRAGCPLPDRDGDGFGDDVDGCPDYAGTLSGCPDTDADGVSDKDDRCPKQAGPKATGGCPDRDNDNVADIDDNCPLMPGKLNGCPDSDKDGVDDASDRCPHIAGEFDGCPEIIASKRSMFEFAVQGIGFDESSSNLDERAYEVLTGLSEILDQYPQYKVRITGNADFIEPVPNRTTLSEQRAKACAGYLKSRGVAIERMVIDGVGAGRPAVREGTSAERAINRRVEFDLFVEE